MHCALIVLTEKLLRAELASHYKRYSKDKDLAILEVEARAKKIGLWSDPNPIPPWNGGGLQSHNVRF